MSVSDLKRTLQWEVVMQALKDAEVDADTLAMVEFSKSAGDMVRGMTQMLVGGADQAQAKNYVKVEIVGLLAPYDRLYVEVVRPGGKTSHELRELLRNRLEHIRPIVRSAILGDTRDLCDQVVNDIDADLATEAP